MLKFDYEIVKTIKFELHHIHLSPFLNPSREFMLSLKAYYHIKLRKNGLRFRIFFTIKRRLKIVHGNFSISSLVQLFFEMVYSFRIRIRCS